MRYIYKYTNKINGKCYVGQTNNIQKRKIGHRSCANNLNSQESKTPFHSALKKYGEENFTFEILEEIPDEYGDKYVNIREGFYIKENQSLVSQNGYNICTSGEVCKREKLTFSECCQKSKIFSEEEIRAIQQMLLDGYTSAEILESFPKLGRSFLENINVGLNFYREELRYPLRTSLSTTYTKKQQEEIIDAIKKDIPYSQIHQKYGISVGMISMINSGKEWHIDGEKYPLSYKLCGDNYWGEIIIQEILYSQLSLRELAKKYERSYACISHINSGRNRRNPLLKYPLRGNLEYNRTIIPPLH